jgi:hypothetical protein
MSIDTDVSTQVEMAKPQTDSLDQANPDHDE